MILSLLHDILQFLLVAVGFILSMLGGLAPYMMLIMVGQMMVDNMRRRGDKHEQNR